MPTADRSGGRPGSPARTCPHARIPKNEDRTRSGNPRNKSSHALVGETGFEGVKLHSHKSATAHPFSSHGPQAVFSGAASPRESFRIPENPPRSWRHCGDAPRGLRLDICT